MIVPSTLFSPRADAQKEGTKKLEEVPRSRLPLARGDRRGEVYIFRFGDRAGDSSRRVVVGRRGALFFRATYIYIYIRAPTR